MVRERLLLVRATEERTRLSKAQQQREDGDVRLHDCSGRHVALELHLRTVQRKHQSAYGHKIHHQTKLNARK